MKKILFIAFLAIFAISSAFAQRRIDPAKQIYLAPGPGYILLSDEDNELQFALLDTITGIGGGGSTDTLVNAGDGRYFYINGDSGDTTIIDTRAGAIPTTVNITIGDTTYNAGANVQNLLIALSRLRIINNNNGTYTLINNGDTTIIDTRADAIPLTTIINVGGTNYNSTNSAQEVLIALSNYNRNNLEGDTITQTAHGFFVGDMVGQNPTTGAFFAASSDDPANFPVAFVSQVLSANQFVIRNEGWLTWTHGLTLYRDYFLQGDGSFATTPDTNYNIFGFRTFKNNRAYFDVPELVVKDTTVTGGGGGGGGVSRYTEASGAGDQLGLVVTTIGIVDSVGLDITTLPISTTIVDNSSTYVVVWDSLTNQNVRIPRSVFDSNNTTLPKAIANQDGISVSTVGTVDSVGLDILGLPRVTSVTDASSYVAVWDSLNNQNVRVPKSSFASGGGGGNTTAAKQVPNRQGLDVTTVGSVDSVGVDISILPSTEYASSAGLNFMVWDSINNRNARVPRVSFPSYTANAGSGLTNTGTTANAVIRLGGTLTTGAVFSANGFDTQWNSGVGGTFAGNLFTISDISEQVTLFDSKFRFDKNAAQFQSSSSGLTSTLFVQDNLGTSIQGVNTAAGRAFYMYQNGAAIEMLTDSSAGAGNLVESVRFDLSTSGVALTHENAGDTDIKSVYAISTEAGMRVNDGGTPKVAKVTNKTVVLEGLPQYADDAAATADGTLPVGGLYLLPGSTVLHIKR